MRGLVVAEAPAPATTAGLPGITGALPGAAIGLAMACASEMPRLRRMRACFSSRSLSSAFHLSRSAISPNWCFIPR